MHFKAKLVLISTSHTNVSRIENVNLCHVVLQSGVPPPF